MNKKSMDVDPSIFLSLVWGNMDVELHLNQLRNKVMFILKSELSITKAEIVGMGVFLI